jgi:hypothetical protein
MGKLGKLSPMGAAPRVNGRGDDSSKVEGADYAPYMGTHQNSPDSQAPSPGKAD